LATIVYCGGSLVPKGGQNILEAAAWGKVIFYGPSMDEFQRRKSSAGKMWVAERTIKKRGRNYCQEIFQALKNPEELQRRGDRGKSV